MNCPCDELFSLYKEMLDLHIGTKTNDIVFHKASEGFYETMFDVFHQISEAMQDAKFAQPMNAKEARSKSYDVLEKAKKLVSTMVEQNKDIGVDNVLRGLVDKLTFDCGTARGFYDGNKDEDVTREKDNEEAGEDKAEETTETPEEEVAEESEEDDSDVADYGIAIKMEPVEEDMEEMSPEEMKAHKEKMMKKKQSEEENNNKMW